MSGLIPFLNARLNERERWALGAPLDKAEAEARIVLPWLNELAPSRPRDELALREIKSQRARLALLDEAIGEMDRLLADDDAEKIDQGVAIGRKTAALEAVKHDAAVYRDHPDYQAGWKP